jgi:hypothetical protein
MIASENPVFTPHQVRGQPQSTGRNSKRRLACCAGIRRAGRPSSDDQVYVDDRTIDSHVKRLRKKFNASDNEFDMIETLYGVGYRFKEL